MGEKGKPMVEKSVDPVENGSDFVESFRKTVKREFGEQMIQLAMERMAPMMRDMALEGGQIAAKEVLYGDDVEKLQKELGIKEKELCKLEREKKALQDKLRNETSNKNELELKLIEKETEIKVAEGHIKALKKQIQAKEKEFNKERSEMEQMKEKHKTEIESLKKQINKLKSKMAVNLAGDNNAKHALIQIREENEKLQAENEELKKKLQKKLSKKEIDK
ncbi:outer dense fiber protein 2-like isoform X2 [Mytilus californianus]|uniref:outer dense fiber protein 2-like isoform X2 n=1 Tax=Mytilus californianus TaxID=6549 RepID=UPI0022460F87|nr:outer dense fiber protein 2-like isoform X2 [Mytilus californianus]